MDLKGNYGWDAPGVIRLLFLVGILSVGAGGVLFALFERTALGLAWFFLWMTTIGAFICFVEAYLMIRSSKKGKFQVIDRLLDDLKLKGDAQVLDVGCGRGALLISAAKRLPEGKVTGIDIWSEKDQSGNSTFHTMQNIHLNGVDGHADIDTADARNLPFPDATFDAIVSCLMLHNLPSAREREKALAEMVRVLKPGGKIGLIDFRHAGEYTHSLERKGFRCHHHGPYWRMFPPATIVIARAPH
ncbi:MAG: class I SAM-dependent methyltransferase [Parachlamydiales bacterium]